MAINKYQTEFNIRCRGSVSGEEYLGNFLVKTRLSHLDRLQRDEARRRFLGPSPEGQVPDNDAKITAEILSQLFVRVLKAPSWWVSSQNGAELLDNEPLVAVYEAALQAEQEEAEKLKAAAVQAEKELKSEP